MHRIIKKLCEQKIIEVQEDFIMFPLSKKGVKLFGEFKKAIRENKMLNKENIKKHNIDLMIAATAVVENCTLISGDAIFPDILKLDNRLRLENWTI